MTPAEEIEQQPQAAKVSVVIVSLDRAALLRESLIALGTEHQVVVVDNGSSDESPQLDAEFPHVRFSKLPRNFGLTKALNIGTRAAEGEYVLLLHDDTRISGESVRALAEYLETHPEAGAACPLLLTESGEVAAQVGSLLSPAHTTVCWAEAPPNGGETVAECVSGAAMMFRAAFLRALRQIDERYGTFGSNIELCSQVRRANRKVVILREVTAVHAGLQSPVKPGLLKGDRVAGTAAYLGKHFGFMAGLLYRVRAALSALFTFRFRALAGAVSGAKIDGAS